MEALATVAPTTAELAAFKPSPAMRAFLDQLLSGKHSTLKDCMEAAGLVRDTYYKWLKRHPVFPEWVKTRIAYESTPLVYSEIASAAAGLRPTSNVAAAKLFLALNLGWSEKTVVEQVVTLTVEAGDSLTAALASARQLRSDAIDVAAEITDG